MPPEPLFDVSKIDQSKLAATREQIYRVNPHRFEFQQLDGIFFIDDEAKLMAGYRDVRDDEFWVRGHIPGRPLLPGVLIIESAAQLISYWAMQHADRDGFLGFGGVDGVKFRGQVVPGDRLILVGRLLELRGTRRVVGATQGFVDGKMVYEGIITGMFI
jgi:3-hydroxyacyl-[acyl-carrier-protein] dehydratase